MYYGDLKKYDETSFRKEIRKLYEVENITSITWYKSLLGFYGERRTELFSNADFVGCAGFKMTDAQIDSAIEIIKREEIEYFCNKSASYRNNHSGKIAYKVLPHNELAVLNKVLKQKIR